MSAIGSQLRTIRTRRGLTLHQVEELSGEAFTAPTLSRYETGRRQISVARAARLAEVYGVTAQELLFGGAR